MWPYDAEQTLAIVRRIAAEVFGAENVGEPTFLAKGSNNAAYKAMRAGRHKFGLSHGDLDPRKVIVGTDGSINLIDWCCSLVSLIPHVDLHNILREIDAAGLEIRAYL